MDNPFQIIEERMIHVENMLSRLIFLTEKQILADEGKLLSPTECRKLFKPTISASTLYRWSRDGIIKKNGVSSQYP